MKYQLTCPKCHHEFQYDNGYIDKNLARLGVEIEDIKLQLHNHKLLPYHEQRQRTDWWIRAKKSLTEKQKEYAELKAIRKASDQQINQMMYRTLKELVKERFGEAVYMELIEDAKKELEAYKASGLMQHEYSSARGKGIININKI